MFNFKQIYVSLQKRSRKTGEKERYRAIVNHTGTEKRKKFLLFGTQFEDESQEALFQIEIYLRKIL